jgi:small glutamine-rich tetratricopeptide repeat-containing protein alpha
LFAGATASQATPPEQQPPPPTEPQQQPFVVDLGGAYELPPEASEEAKAKAEDAKNLGNEAMKELSFPEALVHYTKAVELDGRNSVYFCNRAASYIKLEQYDLALRDTQIAIRLQPNYARAYGRMGVTYSNQNKHIEAITCFQKAVSLDPGNESYINNLRYSQSILAQEMASGFQGGGGANAEPRNINNFFNNPTLINMASQMLQDPSMQQMMQNVMAGFHQQAANEPGNPMENLIQMGQTIANQIRQANPGLAEQLGVSTPPGGNGDGGDNPPPPNSGSNL